MYAGCTLMAAFSVARVWRARRASAHRRSQKKLKDENRCCLSSHPIAPHRTPSHPIAPNRTTQSHHPIAPHRTPSHPIAPPHRTPSHHPIALESRIRTAMSAEMKCWGCGKQVSPLQASQECFQTMQYCSQQCCESDLFGSDRVRAASALKSEAGDRRQAPDGADAGAKRQRR